MSLPFLAAALLAAIGMAALEEFVLPVLAPKLARTDEILSSREVSYGVADYIESAWIRGGEYDHVNQEMKRGVRAMILDAERHPAMSVEAERCRWDPLRRRWVAFEGKVTYESEKDFIKPEGGRPQPKVETLPPGGFVIEAPFKVETLRTSAMSGDRYAFATFKEFLREARARPDLPVWRMKLHSRLAFPLSPLVLLLVGLPSVVAAHSKSFVRGLVTCSLYAGIYYPVYIMATDLGNHGTIPAPIAAWFATGTFGLLGLVAFSRMKT